MHNRRQQSAVEFLTTYGWAIVAIAVAIGVLYSLGIFNINSNNNIGCLPVSGFSCTKPILYSSGTLTAQVGQIGPTRTVTGVGCSSSGTTVPTAWQSTNITIASGQVASLSFQCPGVAGSPIGAVRQETLWIQYTTATQGGGSGVTITQAIATVKEPVQSTGVPNIALGTYYVPITLTNSQSSAAGSGFQQMITFNPSTYSVYEASDLGDLRFYQGGTELYSWCESGCTSGSSSAVFWVKIPGGVLANSNMTVYMSFQSNSLEYDGAYAGECPSCSATYALYDNGANLFNYYINFAGISVPSGWSAIGNALINNGLTLTSPSSGRFPTSGLLELSSTGISLANPGILETYASFAYSGNMLQVSTTGVAGVNATTGKEASSGLFYDQSGNLEFMSSTGGAAFSPQPSPGMHLWTIVNSGSLLGEYDYGNGQTLTTDSPYTYASLQFQADSNPGPFASVQVTDKTVAQWLRIRGYPPSGVMPTTTFGSVTSG